MITENMTKIIFLDIDGVVNHRHCNASCGVYRGIERKCVRNLAKIVHETGAAIVLSSTWRHDWIPDHAYREHIDINTQAYAGKYLRNNLWKKGKLVAEDRTPDLGFRGMKRDDEILTYLKEHPHIKEYVILDDEPFLFNMEKETISQHVVFTNDSTGLTEIEANLAIKILNGETLSDSELAIAHKMYLKEVF